MSVLSKSGVSLAALALAAACENSGSGDNAAVAAATACPDLAALDIANTTFSTVELVEAGAFEPAAASPVGRPADYSSLPAFCRAAGSIKPTEQSDIRFELWLPTEENWNGKFMQTGNGGAAGAIVYSSLVTPLSRGYAVANTDTGHSGTGPGDFSWALGQPEKVIDYQYRAVHELTVAGKALTSARYGRAPDMSYWMGCSTGGRQGLKSVQRYPEDYDAVIAGAPANNWSPLQMQSIFFLNNLGENGLAVSKLGMLKEAAIAACDADDAVTDRVISRPDLCTFDPVQIQCEAGADTAECLTETEVAAARRLYEGPRTSDGQQVMPGTGFGSETTWASYATPFFRIGTSWMQNVVLEDPSWDPLTFDVDTHLALAEEHDQGATKAMVPDISPFTERGGKLLMYHGATDGLIPYGNTVNYYESIVETMGANAVDDHVRFFMVPGMDHCAGGEGASVVDWLAAMEAWVETDSPPEQLSATKPGDDGFTRPICAYPEVIAHDGSGDASEATGFGCTAP